MAVSVGQSWREAPTDALLALVVLYTWLYNNTRGSLLLVTIFHATGNTVALFLPMANPVSSGNTGALVIAVTPKSCPLPLATAIKQLVVACVTVWPITKSPG